VGQKYGKFVIVLNNSLSYCGMSKVRRGNAWPWMNMPLVFRLNIEQHTWNLRKVNIEFNSNKIGTKECDYACKLQ